MSRFLAKNVVVSMMSVCLSVKEPFVEQIASLYSKVTTTLVTPI